MTHLHSRLSRTLAICMSFIPVTKMLNPETSADGERLFSAARRFIKHGFEETSNMTQQRFNNLTVLHTHSEGWQTNISISSKLTSNIFPRSLKSKCKKLVYLRYKEQRFEQRHFGSTATFLYFDLYFNIKSTKKNAVHNVYDLSSDF